MAADVSTHNIKNDAKSNVLITRDFLGGSGGGGGDGSGCFGIESKELDLDLHVPSGFEKRLDLKSGKVYIQRCSPKASSSSSPDRHHNTNFFHSQTTSSSKLQDLNFLPHSKPTLNLFEEPTLDLKLVSPSPPTATANTNSATISTLYQSVCTLDKVKSALDRAERESSSNSNYNKKRSNTHNTSILSSSSLSPSNSSSNMSVDDAAGGGSDDKFSCKLASSSKTALSGDQNGEENSAGSWVTAACPSCLLYVLISKSNPKCPKCGMAIHLPAVTKKPKIDLNIAI